MKRWRLHGLSVASQLDLPAGLEVEDRAADLQLTFSTGSLAVVHGERLVAVDDPTSGRRYSLTRQVDAIVFHADHCLQVRLPNGSTAAEVVVEPGIAPALARVVLAGPALSAMVIARGHDLLHASACVDGTDVVGLLGPPGAGKSTLARLMTRPGSSLFSDDALRVDVEPDVVVAHRGTILSRLRSRPSGTRRSRTDAGGEHVSTQPDASPDGRFLVADQSLAPAAAALKALVVLRLSRSCRLPRLVQLTSSSALVALSTSSPLAGTLHPDLARRLFEHAGRLASRVPTYGLELPWASEDDRDHAADHAWRLLHEVSR